ncbi:MAG: fasciclin domain-containing protein [bacterium]|nr:fasciclin domain-containing protein [bacterium]
MRKLSLVLLMLALAVFSAVSIQAQDSTPEATPQPTAETSEEATPEATAHIRIAHFAPGAGPVQIFINGKPSEIETFDFPHLTGWVEIPVGTYNIAVVPAGGELEDAVIGPVDLSFARNAWITIAAIGSAEAGTLQPILISENYNRVPLGTARVTIVHAIEGGPAVDLIVDGETIPVANLEYGGAVQIEVPAGTYDLQIVESGTTEPALLDLSGTTLDAGGYYIAAAIGTPDEPQAFVDVVTLQQVAEFLTGVEGNIIETLEADGRFTTLLTAIEAAGLTETLSGEGPFTLFAPLDSAFLTIPQEDLDALLDDPEALGQLLRYHVAEGVLLSGDVLELDTIETLEGTVSLTAEGNSVFLNDAQLVVVDIPAANGVIHAISGVLMPMDDMEMEGEATPEATSSGS